MHARAHARRQTRSHTRTYAHTHVHDLDSLSLLPCALASARTYAHPRSRTSTHAHTQLRGAVRTSTRVRSPTQTSACQVSLQRSRSSRCPRADRTRPSQPPACRTTSQRCRHPSRLWACSTELGRHARWLHGRRTSRRQTRRLTRERTRAAFHTTASPKDGVSPHRRPCLCFIGR